MGLHSNKYSSEVTTGWSSQYKAKASGLLTGIENFEFIVIFITVYYLLSHLSEITVKFQSISLGIVNVFKEINEIENLYKELRKSLEDDFQEIFEKAVNIAEEMNIEPAKPRTEGRQKNRANVPSDSIQKYYLGNMAISFLHHIVSELLGQFSSMSMRASKLLGLVASLLFMQ